MKVFLDLGFSEEEASDLVARSHLMITISDYILINGYTARDLELLLGLAPSKAKIMMSGKISQFTATELIRCALILAGYT